MGFLDYFRRSPKSASVAKDRLSIIVARERTATRKGKDYLHELQQELLQVIAKYEIIDLDDVTVNVERNGDVDVLELNIVVAETAGPRPDPPPSKGTPAALPT
jgi:cell division topological specificity factor